MKSTITQGYIEGYYGKLLNWDDRIAIARTLTQHGFDGYFYAPKEDIFHRLNWRRPYPNDWREGFRHFTELAKTHGISVMAGIAPGLDFDFGDIDGGADLLALTAKAHQLRDDGADSIGLLMDDLDPGFPGRSGQFESEGRAHSALANQLAEAIDIPVTITPRIYADEITDGAEGYLEDFADQLDDDIDVFYCGKHIVAHDLDLKNTMAPHAGLSLDRLIIWDNYYANDYCPRRLFLGPWRKTGLAPDQPIMLNPTGMVATDQLLIGLMAASSPDDWQDILAAHDVPEAFFTVAPAFDRPPHPDGDDEHLTIPDADKALTALDELLWRWKTPLSREWYPFLMGLRQDILISTGQASPLRQKKILPPILFSAMENKSKS